MPDLSPLRVAPGGRYFETHDRQPFLWVGANDAITWPGLAGLYRRRDMAGVDAYLANLAAQGVNCLRLMLEYAHRDGRYFERPAGRFNPALVRLWDDLFGMCAEHGLRVLLAPWDNFWMARRWHRHPYNRINGGPAASPAAFFTDEATIQATVRRLCFVSERWGGTGAFAAWDLFNEIHPHWGGTPAQQASVLARLSEAVRETEQRVWGWTRPQTVSVFGPVPDTEYEDLIFRHPSLDFATTHVYEGAIDCPRDTVKPARTMARWVRHALERTPPARPYMDTEHGPIHLFNDHRKTLPEAFDDEYERRLCWAHLASGGAGSGMRWPARHPHTLTPGMTRTLGSVSRFATMIDWSRFKPSPTDARVDLPGTDVFGVGDKTQAVLFLLRRAREQEAQHVPLTLCGLAPGRYSVTVWDTVPGSVQSEAVALVGQASAGLRVTLPRMDGDVALAVCPADHC